MRQRPKRILFTVDQNRRWDRDYSAVRKVLEEGTLGDIYMIRSSHYGVFGKMHDWHVYPECGGGMLYDWGVHLIDQMLDLLPGKIIRITAGYQDIKTFNKLFKQETGMNPTQFRKGQAIL